MVERLESLYGGHCYADFLEQFTPKRFVGGFVFADLSAGELPHPVKRAVAEAFGNENPAVGILEDTGGHAEMRYQDSLP